MVLVRTEGNGRVGIEVKVRLLQGVGSQSDFSDAQKPMEHSREQRFEHIHLTLVSVEAIAGINDAVKDGQ